MGVALTLEQYLKTRNVDFDLTPHHYSEGSCNTALCAAIPSHCLAKAVVFRDEDLHYTMAVVPADHRVLRHTLNEILDRHLELADEDELETIFFDCQQGAIPSCGQAYGLNVVWDDRLSLQADLWLEAGDHENLVHLSGDNFMRLMANCLHETISAAKRSRPPHRRGMTDRHP